MVLQLKGQWHEIFCFRFFHESSSPKPLKITLGSFQIFSTILGDFASQGAPPASLNLPPSGTGSLVPVANLPPVAKTPVAISHRYQRHQQKTCYRRQRNGRHIIRTRSDCLHLKVNVKEQIYL
jgi:hypothetical protein